MIAMRAEAAKVYAFPWDYDPGGNLTRAARGQSASYFAYDPAPRDERRPMAGRGARTWRLARALLLRSVRL